MNIETQIINALEEKKVFIGYYMLCRYLNGKGYVRYGCNAGYKKPFTNGRNRLHPCKILCPESKIYHSRVRYWCEKLAKKHDLFLEKRTFQDSKNPNSETEPHKFDIFVIIALNKEIFENFINNYTLEAFL